MVPRMTMRGLTYLKMSITNLIEKCHHTKQRVLCCTGCCGWRPHTPHESDLLKLVPTEAVLTSLHSLDLAIDEKMPSHGLKRLEANLPFTVKSKLKKGEHEAEKRSTEQFLQRVDDFQARLKGKGIRRGQPMMFVPGQILHLEEGKEYATKT